ncbi:MAG: Rieske 2Fe-2S domain-containing protein [Polyangiales bacterium]
MTPSTRRFTPPIPNGWFVVATSEELAPGTVKPLHYFGKELVVFRSSSGQVAVLDAYCPHLGAHLGHGGKVDGDELVCPFHSWRFDVRGELTSVPYAKRLPQKAKMPCWSVKELAGLVFVWHHALGAAPEWDIPESVPEYDSDEWSDYFTHVTELRSNNLDMAENQVDSAHFHYVHGATNLPRSEGSVDGHIMRVKSITGMQTPMGPVDGIVESTSYGFGLSFVRMSGLVDTLLVATQTPIDDDHLHVRFNFMVKKTGGADVTRGIGKAWLKEVVRQLEQDRPIWENKVQHENPLLCDGDGPIGVFRRWCRQFYTWPAKEAAE